MSYATELQGQQAMCSTGKTKYSLTPLNIAYSPGVEQLDHEEKQVRMYEPLLSNVLSLKYDYYSLCLDQNGRSLYIIMIF